MRRINISQKLLTITGKVPQIPTRANPIKITFFLPIFLTRKGFIKRPNISPKLGMVVSNSTVTRGILGKAFSIKGRAGEITEGIIIKRDIASKVALNIGLDTSFSIFITIVLSLTILLSPSF